MTHTTLRGASRLAWMALAVAACVALVVGWHTFRFVCDDAYIQFRYVSSSQLGWGYTWNPPPFRPVEGYTSFAWVVLLDVVWSLTGMEPPEAAPWLSLAASFVSLGLLGWMALRIPLSPRLEPHRFVVVALVLASTLSNRTFLAWTSSGLETALWTAVVLAWVAVTVFGHGPRAFGTNAVAAIGALVRPDGLLLCLFGAAGTLWTTRSPRRAAVALMPYLAIVLHLVWRRTTYGAWVPNTYQAKVVEPWPVGGAVYLASFLLEYAFFVWLALALVVGAVAARRWWRAGRPGVDVELRVAIVGVAAVIAHWGYYTWLVGGDHFEYRVYHHLVPLCVVSFPWLADQLGWRARTTFAVFAVTTALGLTLPWSHWAHTHTITVMKSQGMPHYRIAPHWPAPVRWYAQAWDDTQGFLIRRFSALRHQSHVNFVTGQLALYPTRTEGLAMDPSTLPVHVAAAAGVAGWTLPQVAVIDKLGLNDAVVARTPSTHSGQWKRKMAHERYAPAAYLACFDPNVKIAGGHATVRPRNDPLTEERIVTCETEWLARVLAPTEP